MRAASSNSAGIDSINRGGKAQVVGKAEGVFVDAEQHCLRLVFGATAREQLEDHKDVQRRDDRQHRGEQNCALQQGHNDQPELLPDRRAIDPSGFAQSFRDVL